MRTLREWFEVADPWEDYLAGVEKHRDLWHGIYERVSLPDDVIESAGLPEGVVRLLAISEDWCGDAVNILPVVARLAERQGWELKVLARDQNLALMDQYLTDGRSRSIPVVIALDEDFAERGWWGPRPAELQRWTLGPGQDLPSADRYKHQRRWYAKDRARTTVAELLAAIGG